MTGPRRPAPERQCQFIVLAKIVLGVAWSPEHRCLHYKLAGNYCRQHQPCETISEMDEVTADRPSRSGH